MNASDLVTLGAAANHLTGWGAFDWFFHILFTILGWIAVATPVYVMHRLETMRVTQPPPPAAPVTTAPEWQYYVMAGVSDSAARSWVPRSAGLQRAISPMLSWSSLGGCCRSSVAPLSRCTGSSRRGPARRSGLEQAGPWQFPLWSTGQSASSSWRTDHPAGCPGFAVIRRHDRLGPHWRSGLGVVAFQSTATRQTAVTIMSRSAGRPRQRQRPRARYQVARSVGHHLGHVFTQYRTVHGAGHANRLLLERSSMPATTAAAAAHPRNRRSQQGRRCLRPAHDRSAGTNPTAMRHGRAARCFTGRTAAGCSWLRTCRRFPGGGAGPRSAVVSCAVSEPTRPPTRPVPPFC